MSNPSDSTRSERRRKATRALWTPRQRRAYLLSEDIRAAIQKNLTDEDTDIMEETLLFTEWLQKRSKQTRETDNDLVIKAIGEHACHTIEEIVEETKLTELIVRRTVQSLMIAGVISIQTFSKRKILVLNSTQELKVA